MQVTCLSILLLATSAVALRNGDRGKENSGGRALKSVKGGVPKASMVKKGSKGMEKSKKDKKAKGAKDDNPLPGTDVPGASDYGSSDYGSSDYAISPLYGFFPPGGSIYGGAGSSSGGAGGSSSGGANGGISDIPPIEIETYSRPSKPTSGSGEYTGASIYP
jgi:hypothetical protein